MRASPLPALLLLASLLAPTSGRAQGVTPARLPTAVGEIVGRLVAAEGGQPITGGSIAVRRGAETAFVGGALPKADGSFVVDGLIPGTYTVRIRALGYAPFQKADVVI